MTEPDYEASCYYVKEILHTALSLFYIDCTASMSRLAYYFLSFAFHL